MSDARAVPMPGRGDAAAPPTAVAFHYTQTDSFSALLQQLGASLVVSTYQPNYRFVLRWRPPFITALSADDRCHLIFLAMVAGRPRCVTALGTTDTERFSE